MEMNERDISLKLYEILRYKIHIYRHFDNTLNIYV